MSILLSSPTLKLIQKSISSNIQCSYINVTENGQHFNIIIVSNDFLNKTLVKRHQLIYKALNKLLKNIHAISIKTFTPEEFKKNKI